MGKPRQQQAQAPAPRPVRADAHRNIEALLQAASAVFCASGVDAPVRDIAGQAGVGVGTIYRHFPKRSDLVVAVLRSEVDAWAGHGVARAASQDAGQALGQWVGRYVEFIATQRGLASALNSADPAFRALSAYMVERLEPVLQALLDAAVAAGQVRGDVRADELLYAIAALCTPPSCAAPHDAKRMVAVFVDGLRHGAQPPPRRR